MAGRFFKFGLIYIASCMVNNSRFEVDQIRMVELGKAKNMEWAANYFGVIRIFSRFPRTKGLIKDLWAAGTKINRKGGLSAFF